VTSNAETKAEFFCHSFITERLSSLRYSSSFISFVFDSKLLYRGEGVLEHPRMCTPQSIGGPDSASDVFSGGPDAERDSRSRRGHTICPLWIPSRRP
jgi:hypothetical protein